MKNPKIEAKEDIETDVVDTKTSDPSSDSSTFIEGEKVLAYHGTRIYEARVQKVESREKDKRYFVHYLGWNKNWDEWLEMDRLLKFSDDNIRKQKELADKQGEDKNVKSRHSSQMKSKISTDIKVDMEDSKNYVGKGKKRKADSSIEEKDTVSDEKLAKIQIPATLKKQLVDDWEFVAHLGKLVKLPRSPCVDEILKKYLDFKSKKDGMIGESIAEILKGLRCYFDKALPAMLLYKTERQQYHEAITDDVSPSTVYGAEHLLRLFVKVPDILASASIEEETSTQLQQKLLDLLKYLQKNQNTFFLTNYEGSIGGEKSGKNE